MITMYNKDGKSCSVDFSQVSAMENNGWYKDKPEKEVKKETKTKAKTVTKAKTATKAKTKGKSESSTKLEI